MDRRTVARYGLNALTAMWILLFLAMVLWSFASGLSPSGRWMLPFGCLAIAMGFHLICFRREAWDYFGRVRPSPRLEAQSRSLAAIVFTGLLLLLLGLVLIHAGISTP